MRLRLVAALAAGLVALAAAASAYADPLDPKVKLTKADEARARFVLLAKTDLGAGWNGGPSATPSSLKAPVCPALRPNYSRLTITGHAESVFDNGNGGLQVVSDVEVWKTVAQARRHMNALLQPKLGACFRYALLKSVGGSNVVILGAKRQKFPKLGDSAVLYRIPLGLKNEKVSVIGDFIMMRKGRTEIYINVIAPAANEKQLTSFETRIARALMKRVRV